MVLWESGSRVALGAGIGLALTIGVAAALGKMLYGVHAVDPIVLGSVAITIGGVALLAAIGPARRAAKADPVRSIRAE
jgi:ABC-type antimicrobial peptide transport system permease subunit